jgi:RND family efflux transporter MFP subunit
VKTGPERETVVPERIAPLVRVTEVEPITRQLRVLTQGTVEPRTESELVPEVSGPVVSVASAFRSGGFFQKGEVLLRVDARDYNVSLERARARLERAESEWARDSAELERRQKLAERDYASPAQVEKAHTQSRVSAAALREARASLEQAERNLARTEIRAPYIGRVRATGVDVGQFVTRGVPVGTIYATDYAEIRLPIPDDDLAFIDLPLWQRGDSASEGPVVILRARFAGAEHEWQGRVVRTEGEIDPRTRMVHVVARVDDPYRKDGVRPPLAVGLFVEAEIAGRKAERVFVLPRGALRAGNRVYVVDTEGKLRIREVELLRTSRTEAVLSAGIAKGDKVVVSPLDTAVDGMAVRALVEGDAS